MLLGTAFCAGKNKEERISWLSAKKFLQTFEYLYSRIETPVKKFSLLFLLGIFSVEFSSAQTELWHIVDSTYGCYGGKVLPLPHNAMFVITDTNNPDGYGVFKYDGNGNIIFRKLFPQPN